MSKKATKKAAPEVPKEPKEAYFQNVTGRNVFTTEGRVPSKGKVMLGIEEGNKTAGLEIV